MAVRALKTHPSDSLRKRPVPAQGRRGQSKGSWAAATRDGSGELEGRRPGERSGPGGASASAGPWAPLGAAVPARPPPSRPSAIGLLKPLGFGAPAAGGEALPSAPSPPGLTTQLLMGQQGLGVKNMALEPQHLSSGPTCASSWQCDLGTLGHLSEPLALIWKVQSYLSFLYVCETRGKGACAPEALGQHCTCSVGADLPGLNRRVLPWAVGGSHGSPGGLPGMGQWAGRGRGEGKRGSGGQAAGWPGKVLVSREALGCLEQEPCSVLCMLGPYTGFHPHEPCRGHTGVATGHLCSVRTGGDRVKASPTLTPLRQQCLGLHPGLRAPSHTFSGSGGLREGLRGSPLVLRQRPRRAQAKAAGSPASRSPARVGAQSGPAEVLPCWGRGGGGWSPLLRRGESVLGEGGLSTPPSPRCVSPGLCRRKSWCNCWPSAAPCSSAPR